VADDDLIDTVHGGSNILDGRDECWYVDVVAFDRDIGTDRFDVDISHSDVDCLNTGHPVYDLSQFQDVWALHSFVHIEQQTSYIHFRLPSWRADQGAIVTTLLATFTDVPTITTNYNASGICY